ncbi:MAG: ribosome-binding factor A [Candidatus Moranbacteria bacterium]|nr:ribosome-binding factor A [Candidatus Moranbacteria bacterium]
MSSLRITKINDLLRSHLGTILERELSLKQGVILTITKVVTSHDLRYARFFVSVFPEKDTGYVSRTLKNELSRIQKSLYAKLYMKPLPKISFELDKTEQKADVVEKILKKLFPDSSC